MSCSSTHSFTIVCKLQSILDTQLPKYFFSSTGNRHSNTGRPWLVVSWKQQWNCVPRYRVQTSMGRGQRNSPNDTTSVYRPPSARRKSQQEDYGPSVVQRECLLSGGLQSWYWWEIWRIRELYYYKQTENIKQLRVACSKCTCTVYCGCCDTILDWIIQVLQRCWVYVIRGKFFTLKCAE
jgi:hypothetical protein